MRSLLLVFLAGFLAAAGLFYGAQAAAPAAQYCLNGSVQAIIAPPIGNEMVAAVDSAQSTLDVMLFQFSYSGLKDALARASARGVRVRVLLEPRVDSNYATAEFLNANGVQVRWATRKFANTHAKIAVIDGRKSLVGSINWSQHAMFQNREVGVLVDNEGLARELSAVFEADWAAGSAYVSGAEANGTTAGED